MNADIHTSAEVESSLRSLIRTLPAGAKIPSERELASSQGLHLSVVRKALKALVEDGTIVRLVGSGSFVGESLQTPPTPPVGTHRIGLLLYSQGDAYAQKLLQSLIHTAQENQVELRSAWVWDLGDECLRQSELLAQDGCTALIFPWFPHQLVGEAAAFIRKCSLPVSIPLAIPGLEAHYFAKPDRFEASLVSLTESLCRYFQGLDRSHIALLGPAAPTDLVFQIMVETYTRFVQRENRPNLCGLTHPGSHDMDQLALAWKEHGRDLAVVSYDDAHALRFMTAMHKLGLNAPEDFVIVGQNDTEGSRFSDPPLSTVSLDFAHQSQGLLDHALASAQGLPFQEDSPSVAHLLVRETCGGQGNITPGLRNALPELDIRF